MKRCFTRKTSNTKCLTITVTASDDPINISLYRSVNVNVVVDIMFVVHSHASFARQDQQDYPAPLALLECKDPRGPKVLLVHPELMVY